MKKNFKEAKASFKIFIQNYVKLYYNIIIKKEVLMFSKLMQMSRKEFINKLLNGVAIGIVIGLIPNAILGEVFKALKDSYPFLATPLFVVQSIQSAVPLLIGCLVAVQFAFTPVEIATLGLTTFISSGVVKVIMVNDKALLQLQGIGDLINIILIASLGVIFIQLLKGRLGALSLLLVPLFVVTILGSFGVVILPYVSQISIAVGEMIKKFTELQPLLMSILIAVSFSIIIISPMSTVAIGIAVGLTGLASGAANLGIASCAMTLIVGSFFAKNKLGIILAVFFGSMKLFIPNWTRHPIINLPIILNGILAGIWAYLFNIQGTPQSSGFGFSGMVGPINAYRLMEHPPLVRVGMIVVAYFVLTTLGAYIIHQINTKVLKVYTEEIYIFK